MAAPSAGPQAHEPSPVFVPESLQERVEVGLELKKAVFEAYRANDPAELRRRQLKESQYLISCTIHDLQHPSASSPLPPQFHAASPELLRGLQADLARVNEQLARDHPGPAAPTTEEHQH